MKTEVKMSWYDFPTPYFTLKYYHLKIYLHLLHTGPKSLPTGLQYVVASVQGGPSDSHGPVLKSPEADPLHVKYT